MIQMLEWKERTAAGEELEAFIYMETAVIESTFKRDYLINLPVCRFSQLCFCRTVCFTPVCVFTVNPCDCTRPVQSNTSWTESRERSRPLNLFRAAFEIMFIIETGRGLL